MSTDSQLRKFYFVAGEQIITHLARNALDAWLGVEIMARSKLIASEFRTQTIIATDDTGAEIGRGTWKQWNASFQFDLDLDLSPDPEAEDAMSENTWVERRKDKTPQTMG